MIHSENQPHLSVLQNSISFSRFTHGSLQLAKDATLLKQLVNDSEHISNSRQILSTPEEMIKQEPTLATVKERLYGGVYNNLGTNGDMYEFCCQLRDILIQKYLGQSKSSEGGSEIPYEKL